MVAVLTKPTSNAAKIIKPTREEIWSARVATTIQVVHNKLVVGCLYLDADDKLLKRDVTVPPAVALKVLVMYYHQDEMFGEVPTAGGRYVWGVVGCDD